MNHQMTNSVATASSSNPSMITNNNSNNPSAIPIKIEPTRSSYNNMDN